MDTPWRRNVNQFTIASYGPGFVDFNISSSRAPIDLLEKILCQKAKLQRDKLKYYHDQNEPKIGYMFEHCNDGYGFFYFENNSDSTVLTVTINLIKLQGCKLGKYSIHYTSEFFLMLFSLLNLNKRRKIINLFLVPPYSGDQPKVMVNPQSSKIVAYKMIDERASINFRILASFKKGAKVLQNETKSKGKRHARYYNHLNYSSLPSLFNKNREGIFFDRGRKKIFHGKKEINYPNFSNILLPEI